MAKQERAIRTRNALVHSAATLFDRDGFEVASLATISARAGVSSGALHFHFPSKAALADAVVAAAGDRLVRITREREALALQILIDASHELVQGLRCDPVLRVGFALSADPERTRAARDLRRGWREWVESVVVRAERAGLLAPDVVPRDLAAAVVAVAAGHEALGHQDPGWLERAPLTRFWAFLLPRAVGDARVGLFVASGDAAAEPYGTAESHGTGTVESHGTAESRGARAREAYGTVAVVSPEPGAEADVRS
ncbi:ScbR family autoregulator-binding transcription factor [Streptomyces sp. NPDC090025]|uniref:ScbR family autoregulator-binding transcription factor n=1 Tax=Streptomyces sp. NPDC090025 TaxID=3365922 RepID=UPI0038343BD1